MKRIAPELDRLMWALVEEDNDGAIREFALRHPELRTELMRRASMVVGLKNAKPIDTKTTRKPPPFRPRSNMTHSTPNRALYVIAACAIAAIGIASFLAGSFLFPSTPVTAVQQQSPPPQPVTPKISLPQNPPVLPREQPIDETVPPVTVREQPSAKTINIRLASAPLLSVIEAIGAQSNLKIVIAPGMMNPTIDAEYNNLTAMAVLEDLGKQNGFTAFDQGDGSVIIVPAVQRDSVMQHGRLGG
jgi:hypothetical protein